MPIFLFAGLYSGLKFWYCMLFLQIFILLLILAVDLWTVYTFRYNQVLSTEEAVRRTKIMYEILQNAGINIIRVGLKASEIMEDQIGFHPAFRQLVESEIAKDRISRELDLLGDDPADITVYANSRSFGNIYGHKGINREFFQKKYPHLHIKGAEDDSLKDDQYRVIRTL
jgi:hypothetical protein